MLVVIYSCQQDEPTNHLVSTSILVHNFCVEVLTPALPFFISGFGSGFVAGELPPGLQAHIDCRQSRQRFLESGLYRHYRFQEETVDM
jgi:hypothetical protein